MASLADIGTRLVAEAKKFIGDPYVYGAAGPKSFDCSGLIYYSLKQLGDNSVPRTSEQQYQWADKIKYSQLQPGDLIFMQFPGDNAPPGHVVIYAGNGKIIQAPQPGQDVQEISWSPSDMPSWGGRIVGYGRIPGSNGSSGNQSGGGSPALGLAGGISSALSEIPGFGFLGGIVTGLTGTGQTLGDVATAVAGISNDLSGLMHFFAALFRPSLWLRVGAFFAGLVAVGLGLWAMAKALDIPTPSLSNVPIPIPV
jgi:NlpC/P60 family protein